MNINITNSIAGKLPPRGYERSVIESSKSHDRVELTNDQVFNIYSTINEICSRSGETRWPTRMAIPSILEIFEESISETETITLYPSFLPEEINMLISHLLLSGSKLSEREIELALASTSFRAWGKSGSETESIPAYLQSKSAVNVLDFFRQAESDANEMLSKYNITVNESTTRLELMQKLAELSRNQFYGRIEEALKQNDMTMLDSLSNTERFSVVTSPHEVARRVRNIKYHIEHIETIIGSLSDEGVSPETREVRNALKIALSILLKKLYQKLLSNFRQVIIMTKMYFKTVGAEKEPNHDIHNTLIDIAGTLMGKGFHRGAMSSEQVEDLYREHLERINIYDRYINGVAQNPVNGETLSPINVELDEQTQKFLNQPLESENALAVESATDALIDANEKINKANMAQPSLQIHDVAFTESDRQEPSYIIDQESGEITMWSQANDQERIKAIQEYMAASRVKVLKLFMEKILHAEGLLSSDTTNQKVKPADGKWKVRILTRSSGGMSVESNLCHINIPSSYDLGFHSSLEIVAHEFMHMRQRINAQKIAVTNSNGETTDFALLSRIGLGNGSQNSEAGALITERLARQEFSGEDGDTQRANTSYVQGIAARMTGANYGAVARAMFDAYLRGGMSPDGAAKLAASRAYRIFLNILPFSDKTPGIVPNSKDLAYAEQLLYTSALADVDSEFTGVTAIAGVNFVDLSALDAVGLVNIREVSRQDTARQIIRRVKDTYDSFGILDF